MFTISDTDIRRLLHDYGIGAESFSVEELERYHYEQEDPEFTQVRLIVKVILPGERSLVLRFKKEDDASQKIMEEQSRFAALLYAHGITTPKVYASEGVYARNYTIGGVDVTVMIEDFEEGELKAVDLKTAEETGELLAKMHNISEQADFHVDSKVLFDPLGPNDLFSFDAVGKHQDELRAVDRELLRAIVQKHEWLVSKILPLKHEPRYAVQGDISDCNLYRTRDGRLGIFDFNRCGDNRLFFDAIMQAIFEARLMVYTPDLEGHQEERVLSAFLKGYHRIRPFTAAQKAAFPYLYALVSAFWLSDMKWNEDSLANAMKAGDRGAVRRWMKKICERESSLYSIPI